MPTTSVLTFMLTAALGLLSGGCGDDSNPPTQGGTIHRKIIFNGRELTPEGLAAWEQVETRGNFRLPDGSFWYDVATGAAGLWGGPTSAFLPAGLPFSVAMPPNCSGGGTHVFVNGRELHPADVTGIQNLVGVVPPGRYGMDSSGNFRREGGPLLGNLLQLAQRVGARRDGSWSHYMNDGAGTRASVMGNGRGDYYYSDSKGNSWWPGK